MVALNGKRMFPCPVCSTACDVRISKKNKPYVVCDPCGIQCFIRGPAGIESFNRLVDRANREDTLTRLSEMEQRYHLKCPECGCRFWAEPQLVKTSVFDGSFQGFRCPQKNCGAIVPWEKKE